MIGSLVFLLFLCDRILLVFLQAVDYSRPVFVRHLGAPVMTTFGSKKSSSVGVESSPVHVDMLGSFNPCRSGTLFLVVGAAVGVGRRWLLHCRRRHHGGSGGNVVCG